MVAEQDAVSPLPEHKPLYPLLVQASAKASPFVAFVVNWQTDTAGKTSSIGPMDAKVFSSLGIQITYNAKKQ